MFIRRPGNIVDSKAMLLCNIAYYSLTYPQLIRKLKEGLWKLIEFKLLMSKVVANERLDIRRFTVFFGGADNTAYLR